MANEFQYTSISSIIPQIYEAALLTLRDRSIIAPLVTAFNGQGLATRIFGTAAEGTVQTLAGTTDMTAQAFLGSASGTLTPAMYGAQYFLNDSAVDTAPYAAGLAGQSLGNVIAEKVDVDLCGIFPSFTGSIGSAGGTLTWANLFNAVAQLRTNKAPAPYVAVLHPMQWYYLSAATSVPAMAAAPEWMNQFSRDFFMGNFGGVSIVIDTNIGTPGNAGLLFSQQAIALDVRRAFRIEQQRDASRGGGGWELNATMIYGTAIWRPTFGIKLMGTCA